MTSAQPLDAPARAATMSANTGMAKSMDPRYNGQGLATRDDGKDKKKKKSKGRGGGGGGGGAEPDC